MANRWTQARKAALAYIGLDADCDMSYSDVAKRVAFKDQAIVDGLDLNDRLIARAMLLAWADRQKIVRQRSYG